MYYYKLEHDILRICVPRPLWFMALLKAEWNRLALTTGCFSGLELGLPSEPIANPDSGRRLSPTRPRASNGLHSLDPPTKAPTVHRISCWMLVSVCICEWVLVSIAGCIPLTLLATDLWMFLTSSINTPLERKHDKRSMNDEIIWSIIPVVFIS